MRVLLARRLWLPHMSWGVDALALAVLLLAILAPLLFRPGYILLHDWAWTPAGMMFSPLLRFPAHEFWGSGIYPPNTIPLQALFGVLGVVLTQPLLQRLFLLAMFVGLAAGAWRLVPMHVRSARLYAATLVVVNPWVYDRLASGQWFALAGIAVLPWALLALLRAYQRTRLRDTLLAALAWALLGVVDTHAFALFLPTIVIGAAVHAFLAPARTRAIAMHACALIAVAALLTVYWTAPALRGVPAFETITSADLQLFATQPDARYGLLFNVASMHGFWYADAASKLGAPLWGPLFLVILVVAGWGVIIAWRDPAQRPRVLTVVLAAFVAWLLAMGASGPTGFLYAWAFEHLPGMHGLREAQRAAALLPLAYGVCGAYAVAQLSVRRPSETVIERVSRLGRPGVLLLVVCVYTFRLFWGGLGALTPSQYPPSWAEARALVRAESDGALLVLPWHRFMRLSFTGDLNVIDPAPTYFGGVVLASDDDETGIPSARSADQRLRYLAAIIERRSTVRDLGNLLSVVGVRYVFLVHGGLDYEEDRAFLDRQHDLRLVRTWSDAALYRNERPVALTAAVDAVRAARGIDDLIAAAADGQALADFVWVPASSGASGSAAPGAAFSPLPMEPGAFGSLLLPPPRARFVQTAAVAPGPGWRLGNAEALETIAPVLAFPVADGDTAAALRRQGTYGLLVGYVVSAASALVTVAAVVLIPNHRLRLFERRSSP